MCWTANVRKSVYRSRTLYLLQCRTAGDSAEEKEENKTEGVSFMSGSCEGVSSMDAGSGCVLSARVVLTDRTTLQEVVATVGMVSDRHGYQQLPCAVHTTHTDTAKHIIHHDT